MKFRMNNGEDDCKDYIPVNGVYLNGKVEEELGYDCVAIFHTDADPFELLVNKSNGIDGLKVEVDGYPGETVLFAWKSNIGVPLVANPGFEMMWFRGLIVDPADTKSLEYAKRCFETKSQVL